MPEERSNLDFPICAECGWKHDTNKPHVKAQWRGPLASPPQTAPSIDPYEKYRELERRAGEQPSVYTKTERTCPGCGTDIWQATNCLGITYLGVHYRQVPVTLTTGEQVMRQTDDDYEDHQRTCTAPQVDAIPDLKTVRRAGLPYREDDE